MGGEGVSSKVCTGAAPPVDAWQHHAGAMHQLSGCVVDTDVVQRNMHAGEGCGELCTVQACIVAACTLLCAYAGARGQGCPPPVLGWLPQGPHLFNAMIMSCLEVMPAPCSRCTHLPRGAWTSSTQGNSWHTCMFDGTGVMAHGGCRECMLDE